MSDQIDIKVSEGLVKGIIESKVQTAIVSALSKESNLVERVVAEALNQRVNSSGKVDTYSSHNKFTYIDILCKKTITEAANTALKQWVTESKKRLEEEFYKQLQTKKTSSKVIKACVDGLAEATKSSWTFKVVFPE